MNLLTRMKPEHRDRLEETKEKYPNSYDWVIEELTHRTYITEVPYGVIIQLTIFHPSVWDMFYTVKEYVGIEEQANNLKIENNATR